MSFTTLHARRLLKWADAVATHSPDSFDFTVLVKQLDGDGHHTCGTICCAAGLLPVVFPKMFTYEMDDCKGWTVEGTDRMDWNIQAEIYFGLHYEEIDVLTQPDFNLPSNFRPKGVSNLPSNATPKQVAANIRRMVRYKCKEHGIVLKKIKK